MNGEMAVCVTVHGLHRKSNGVTLAAPEHLRMIEDSIARLCGAETYPVIISAARASLWDEADLGVQQRWLRLWVEHRLLTTCDDLNHQEGAFATIYQGMLAALAMDCEWLFVTSDDILFTHENPARFAYEMAVREGLDYLSAPRLGEPHLVNTQVFICRVRALLDPERDWRPFTIESFRQDGAVLEHYTTQTLIDRGIPYAATCPLDYHHTHDPAGFEAVFAELEKRRTIPARPEPDCLIGIPFVNGRRLLRQAVNSVEPFWDRTVIVDNSPGGLEPGEWPVKIIRPPTPLSL